MNKNKSVVLVFFITLMFLFIMGMLIFSCIVIPATIIIVDMIP